LVLVKKMGIYFLFLFQYLSFVYMCFSLNIDCSLNPWFSSSIASSAVVATLLIYSVFALNSVKPLR